MRDTATVECGAAARARIFWPGHAPYDVCGDCLAHAQRTARVMGFTLQYEETQVGTCTQQVPSS